MASLCFTTCPCPGFSDGEQERAPSVTLLQCLVNPLASCRNGGPSTHTALRHACPNVAEATLANSSPWTLPQGWGLLMLRSPNTPEFPCVFRQLDLFAALFSCVASCSSLTLNFEPTQYPPGRESKILPGNQQRQSKIQKMPELRLLDGQGVW